MTIRVLVSGSGKMGREVLAAVCRESDLEPAGVVDLFSTGETISLPDETGAVPFGTDAGAIIEQTRPDVAVDFTNAEWTPRLAEAALAAGVRLVIGTSGLKDEFVRHLGTECDNRGLGAVIAPNFALGAILMQHMAKTAARFYQSAEIIELHHDQKIDAPSGTAIATAKGMAEARGKQFRRAETRRENLPGTRGGEAAGVTIHSVRLPGLVAHQEVILGSPGEILTIRHDTLGRESFMPGVLLAVHHVMEHPGLVVGLDRLIGLE
ncbi:MAG TPA: 4-hydroxy-tetrahydrodipicolinate reductase [Dehalococcoidia bacterium]|jgi:4-hydroxy-tetrahydrodipicolinate reductase|nr:4-hydroxy-tetrahydrodipicolinate reductase [Dehalococcoidia bacterium]